MAIVIKDFKKHYEKSDNKKVKEMKWLSLPIKFEGLKYRRLMKMSDGMEILGVWIVLLQLSAKMPVRGVLANSDGDLTLGDITLMTDCPLKSLKKAIPVLSSKDIGWISDNLPTISDNPRTTLQNTTEHNTTEQDTKAFEKFWNTYNKKTGKSKCEKKFKKLSSEEISLIEKNLPAYVESTPEVKYRKDPLTYLNGEHWNDEITKQLPSYTNPAVEALLNQEPDE